MHSHDQHLLVIGAVEDADASALGQIARGTPEEIVLQLRCEGGLKLNTSQPWGLTPDMTCSIAPSLPAASIA